MSRHLLRPSLKHRIHTAGGMVLHWLLRDGFDTADAAPVADGPAVPGPGTRDVTDTDDASSISAGKLHLVPHSTPVWGDPGIWYPVQTRAAGLAFMVTVTPAAVDTMSTYGWKASKGGIINLQGIILHSDGKYSLQNMTLGISLGIPYTAATEQQMAIILGNVGAYYYIKNAAIGTWQLLWHDATDVTASLYPGISNYSATLTADDVKVADLTPFQQDIEHFYDTGAVAASTTFTHPRKFAMTFTLTTLPSAGTIDIFLRYQDANNYWKIAIDSGAGLDLIENVAGTPATRATIASGLVNGQKIFVRVDGDTMTGYYKATEAWEYTSATTFQDATVGELDSLGTGGAVSELRVRELGTLIAGGRYDPPGYATQSVLGPLTVGQSFTHPADCRMSFTLDALPAAGERVSFIVRQQDATHNWRWEVDSDGDIDLIEDNAGDTTRINAEAGLTGGEVLTAIWNDETVKLYNGSTLEGTYTSAANFKTETDGSLLSIGTDGIASNLIIEPLTPDGAFMSALERMENG